jgi:hypothetical protein
LTNSNPDSGEAIDIAIQSESMGSLLRDSLSETIELNNNSVIHLGEQFTSPEVFAPSLVGKHLTNVVLKPAENVSAKELVTWLSTIRRMGINIQLVD